MIYAFELIIFKIIWFFNFFLTLYIDFYYKVTKFALDLY